MAEPGRRRTSWTYLGVAAGALLNLAWAWFGTGPTHYEWTDSAIFMTPAGAVIGGWLGYLSAVVVDRRVARRDR